MLTIEKINLELEEFCRYMCCNLPPVINLEHCEICGAIAKFTPDIPTINNYKIEIANTFYQQDTAHQKAILWHEFTHLYDWKYGNISKDSMVIYLYTYSEAHATEIQYRSLLNLAFDQTISFEKVSQTDEKNIRYKKILASYLEYARKQFELFAINKSSYTLTNFIRTLSYYSGICMIFDSKYRKVFLNSLEVISSKYKHSLIEYVEAVLSRDFCKIKETRQKLVMNIQFGELLG